MEISILTLNNYKTNTNKKSTCIGFVTRIGTQELCAAK